MLSDKLRAVFLSKKSTKYETIVEETFHLLLVSIILVGLFPYFSGFVLVLPVVSLEFVSVVSFLFVSAISMVLVISFWPRFGHFLFMVSFCVLESSMY